ncbi:MAG TPA: TadE/TadG family type IV pilus assembly protein, partial [Chloroflexota bacterium]
MAPRREKAQALVELAIVMPVLVGMIAVLFQLGVLFVAYLSLTHEMRDIGRWVAVHPDTIDGTSCASANSLWAQLCTDAPSVIDPARLSLAIVQGTDGQTRSCAALVGGKCTTRPAGVELRLRVSYDASSIIFLPSNFRLGPWFLVKVPTVLPPYDYASIVVDDAQLQNTVDAASLAGANSLSTNAWKGNGTPQAIASATAASYLTTNGVNIGSANTTVNITFPTSTPIAGVPTPTTPIPVDNIQMQVTRSHQTAFWPLIGIPQVTMSNGGNAHAARGLVDVMLSLDMTYSMELTGSIQSVRDAVVSFVSQMRPSTSDPSGPLIGIARFAGIKCDYQATTTWQGTTYSTSKLDSSTCSN